MEEVLALGGGCFWCTEAVFREVRGIVAVEVGYCNGHAEQVNYEAVCTGETGYCEVVHLRYETDVVALNDLLEVFFLIHDPTTLNRQGHDVGTQYRSGLFWTVASQAQAARDWIAIQHRERLWEQPVVTEIAPLSRYHRAEDYHQDFFAKNPQQGYCLAVAAPKVAKFRQTLARLRK